MSTPAVGPAVTETTIRKRTLSRAEAEKEGTGRQTPEFWEFLEAMTDDMWSGDYALYILREDPKPSNYGGTNTIDKCAGYIDMPGGQRVKLDSREDVELAIKQKFGGKAYRLILKKGRERITEGKCVNEAPPKYPESSPQPHFAGPLPNAQSDSNAIATKAIDTIANQPQEAMNIALGALRASAEIIARTVNPGNAPPSPSADSDLDRAFKQAMIAKLLAEPPKPPDPVESFLRMRDLFTPPQNTMVEKIVTVAMERFMSPAAATSGRTTLLDLGREFIPVLGNTVKETMHEYRLTAEANVRALELQRGFTPAPAQPMQPNPQPAALPAAVEAAAPSAPQQTAPPAEGGMPSFQWIEERIARIAKDLNFTVDEAVDETLSFLYNVDPRIVGLLLDPPKLDPRLKPGEDGLLQLFQYEPILQQVPVGPRLTEYIKKFVAAAKEAEATRMGAAKPPAQPPSA